MKGVFYLAGVLSCLAAVVLIAVQTVSDTASAGHYFEAAMTALLYLCAFLVAVREAIPDPPEDERVHDLIDEAVLGSRKPYGSERE